MDQANNMDLTVENPNLRQLGKESILRVIYAYKLYKLQHELSSECGLFHASPPTNAANSHVFNIILATDEEKVLEEIGNANRFAGLIHQTAHFIALNRVVYNDLRNGNLG